MMAVSVTHQHAAKAGHRDLCEALVDQEACHEARAEAHTAIGVLPGSPASPPCCVRCSRSASPKTAPHWQRSAAGPHPAGYKRAAGGRCNRACSLACKTKVQGKVLGAKCMSSRSLSCGAPGSSRRCVFELHFFPAGSPWGAGSGVCARGRSSACKTKVQEKGWGAKSTSMWPSPCKCTGAQVCASHCVNVRHRRSA